MTKSTRRRLGAATVLGLSLGIGALQLSPMASPAQAAPSCNDSKLLTVIGVPGEAIGAIARAGVVEARFECPTGRRHQALRLPKVHRGDGFGTSVARGYFNRDDHEDVAVGIPGLDVGKRKDAGGVAIFYGSATGLKFGKLITQSSKGIPGKAQTGARFGAAVAADGYVGDAAYLLRIGAPGRKVSGHKQAGAFIDLSYRNGRFILARQVTLASRGVPGSPGTGDNLGAALTGSYAVGAPGRKVSGQAGAGAVLVYRVPAISGRLGTPATLLTQASPGIADTPERGDHFGAALTRNWVGAPGESVAGVPEAGAVFRYYPGTFSGNPGFQSIMIVPGSGGVPGTPQSGARFGASLTDLGFYIDDTEWHAQDLLIGAPGFRTGGHARAGSVTAIGVNEPTADGGGDFSFNGQYQLLTAQQPITGAAFGSSLARLGEAGAVVGAPGALGGQVDAYQTNGSFDLPLNFVTTWQQQAGHPEPGDAFGASLASPGN